MTVTILETAVAASKAGIAVVPVKEDGSKQPDVSWKAYEERLPTREELTAWFHNTSRTGIGFVCGHASGGLELLEFDDPDAIVTFKTAAVEAGLWDIVKRLELGYCETTPGGGIHWLYRVAEPLKNTKLAARPCPEECTKHQTGRPHVMIETRGVGGYVVVAPSHGKVHETGNAYELRAGSIESIPTLTVDERDELFALAQMLDQMPRPTADPRPRIEAAPGSGERPGDDFNRRASWAEVLEPHGWKRIRRIGALDYWRRPGKEHGNHSATTGVRGGDASADYLYVFSSSTEFDSERGYSKYAAYTVLNYGTDVSSFATSARDLRARGYGGDMGDLLFGGGSAIGSTARAQAGEMGEAPPPNSSADVPDEDEDEPRERKASAYRDPNYQFECAFPPGHFVARYVDYARQRTDAPHEYHETLGVMLLAACTPGVRAFLDPWPFGLATNLYAVLVGSSTRTRKSTATRITKEILRRIDPGAVFPDRFSPEAFVEQLSYRPRVPSIWFPDEWGKVVEQLPRDPKFEDGLLQLYDSPPEWDYARHSKRMKGGDTVEDQDKVRDPHFFVIGATTEAVFDSLSNASIESGFLPRHAFVYPEKLPQRRKLTDSSPHLKPLQDALVGYLRGVYEWSQLAFGEISVAFDDAALELLDAYQEEIEDGDETAISRMQAMAIKVSMLSAVGGLDLTGESPQRVLPITVEDALRGIAMARRWADAALRFAQEAGGFDRVERRFQQRCAKALRFLKVREACHRQDIMRVMRVSSEELDRIQRQLVDEGLLFVAQGESAGGRPPLIWKYVAGRK